MQGPTRVRPGCPVHSGHGRDAARDVGDDDGAHPVMDRGDAAVELVGRCA